MTVALLQILLEQLYLVRCLLNKVSSSNQFSFVVWIGKNGLTYCFICNVDPIYSLFAVCVNILENLIPNLECLLTKLVLHFGGLNTEKREVYGVVRKVEDLIAGVIVVLYTLT